MSREEQRVRTLTVGDMSPEQLAALCRRTERQIAPRGPRHGVLSPEQLATLERDALSAAAALAPTELLWRVSAAQTLPRTGESAARRIERVRAGCDAWSDATLTEALEAKDEAEAGRRVLGAYRALAATFAAHVAHGVIAIGTPES